MCHKGFSVHKETFLMSFMKPSPSNIGLYILSNIRPKFFFRDFY